MKTTPVKITLEFDGQLQGLPPINIPQEVMDDHDIHDGYSELIGNMVINAVIQHRARSKLTSKQIDEILDMNDPGWVPIPQTDHTGAFAKEIPEEILEKARERGFISPAIGIERIVGTKPEEGDAALAGMKVAQQLAPFARKATTLEGTLTWYPPGTPIEDTLR